MSDQDEVERLADKDAIEYWHEGDTGYVNPDTRGGFIRGYRAGRASQDERMKYFEGLHDRYTTLREENERNNEAIGRMTGLWKRSTKLKIKAEAELTAEKLKSQKLVDALKIAQPYVDKYANGFKGNADIALVEQALAVYNEEKHEKP